MGSTHSSFLDALGTVTLVAYLGFLGGYVGTFIRMGASRLAGGSWTEDPLWIGQHTSAAFGLIGALTIAITYV